MIPEDSIIEWRQNAPWKSQDMIEQDLVISRALYQRMKGRDLFHLWIAFEQC